MSCDLRLVVIAGDDSIQLECVEHHEVISLSIQTSDRRAGHSLETVLLQAQRHIDEVSGKRVTKMSRCECDYPHSRRSSFGHSWCTKCGGEVV